MENERLHQIAKAVAESFMRERLSDFIFTDEDIRILSMNPPEGLVDCTIKVGDDDCEPMEIRFGIYVESESTAYVLYADASHTMQRKGWTITDTHPHTHL